MIKNLLRMADVISVKEHLVSYILEEDNALALLDAQENVLAILPDDKKDVTIHMAIRGNTQENTYYDFDLDQNFLGVSKFHESK